MLDIVIHYSYVWNLSQQTSSERRIIRQTVQSHRSCQRRRIKWFHVCPPGTTLVQISAGLSTEGTCPIIDFPITADSCTAWYQIASKSTAVTSRVGLGGLLKHSTNCPPCLPVDVNVRDNGKLPLKLGIFMFSLNYRLAACRIHISIIMYRVSGGRQLVPARNPDRDSAEFYISRSEVIIDGWRLVRRY
jgi:hypothetical protein